MHIFANGRCQRALSLILIDQHMDRNIKYTADKTNTENIGKVFRKMIADKKAVQSYIREKGTLEGFQDETITFAKPL